MDRFSSRESSREKGGRGESQAVEFLEGKKFKIVKQNFHFGKRGEIDLIAKDGETLVFVEVKSRSSNSYGDPLESITPRKQKTIRRVAEGYLYINKINDVECRFDVVTVDFRAKPPEIEHLINAF